MSFVARRVLPDASRRGWCPSLARPMPTGDGLLARVHPPLGILSVAQLRAVAKGARCFGNGHVDVTARGNLQIRGVREATAGPLAAWLAQAGLGDTRDDGGPQRLTVTSPLAGLETDAASDVPALARAIEAAGRCIAGLPAKTLVAVAGAGVSGDRADILVRPMIDGRVAIVLAGDDGAAIIVRETEAADAVAALLHAFAATAARRLRDLTVGERVAMLRAVERIGRASDAVRPPSPRARGEGRAPLVGGEASPPGDGEGNSTEEAVPAKPPHPWLSPRFGDDKVADALSPRAGGGSAPGVTAAILPAGLTSLGRSTILAVEAPFGRCTADALERLAEVADEIAALDIRTTPARGFVLASGSGETAQAALEALAAARFITRPDDPRRAVAACPGAPACASGTTPVPDHAAALAHAFAPFAARGLTAHVSGCAKACAHPAPADLTLVAKHGGYGVVLHGTPRAAPALRLTFEEALERVRRADPAAALANAFRTDTTP